MVARSGKCGDQSLLCRRLIRGTVPCGLGTEVFDFAVAFENREPPTAPHQFKS